MMRLRRRRHGRRIRAEMNVVPYIDVMLVLLVIFMIAAPLINQGVEVKLPVAPGERFTMPEGLPDGQQPLVISIDAQGHYQVNAAEQVYTQRDALLAYIHTIRTRYPQLPVIVRGDRSVRYDAVLQLALALKESGVDDVGLATSRGDDPVSAENGDATQAP